MWDYFLVHSLYIIVTLLIVLVAALIVDLQG